LSPLLVVHAVARVDEYNEPARTNVVAAARADVAAVTWPAAAELADAVVAVAPGAVAAAVVAPTLELEQLFPPYW